MPISQFIKKEIVSATPDQSIEDVANLMRDHNVGAVLICDDEGQPLGMVTDRDIVLRCVCEGGDCNDTYAEDIMSQDIQTVHEDAGLMDILECMRSTGVRRVPLVDQRGKATALVSFGDVLELLTTELSALAVPATPEVKKIDRAAA